MKDKNQSSGHYYQNRSNYSNQNQNQNQTQNQNQHQHHNQQYQGQYQQHNHHYNQNQTPSQTQNSYQNPSQYQHQHQSQHQHNQRSGSQQPHYQQSFSQPHPSQQYYGFESNLQDHSQSENYQFQDQPYYYQPPHQPDQNSSQQYQDQEFYDTEFDTFRSSEESPVLSLQYLVQRRFHPLSEQFADQNPQEAKTKKDWEILSYPRDEFILVSLAAESLTLSGPFLTRVIIDCPNLHTLTIKRQKNGVPMETLVVICPKLKELTLKSSVRCESGIWITSSMLESVLSTCPEIESLSLSYTYGILSPEFSQPGFVPIPVVGPTITPYLSRLTTLFLDGVGEPYDGSPLIVDISSSSLRKLHITSENVCHYVSLFTPSLTSLYMTASQDFMTSFLHIECPRIGTTHLDPSIENSLNNSSSSNNARPVIAYGFLNLIRSRCDQCEEWIQGDRTPDGIEIGSTHYIKKYESVDYRSRIDREKLLSAERVKRNLGMHSFSRGGRWSGDRERKENIPYHNKLVEIDSVYHSALDNKNNNQTPFTAEQARETVEKMENVLQEIPDPDRTWIQLYKMYSIEGGENPDISQLTKQLCKLAAEKEITSRVSRNPDQHAPSGNVSRKVIEEVFHSKLNEYSYPWKSFEAYVGISLQDWARSTHNISYHPESDSFSIATADLNLASLSLSDSPSHQSSSIKPQS